MFMNSIKATLCVTACGLCWIASAAAQAPTPTNGSATNPAAASTPHQGDVTGNATANGQEVSAPTNGNDTNPSAAASPHHQSVTGNSANPAHNGAPISPQDFITKASQDGMTEVKLAELASQKSQNQSVRQFAASMQKDHSAANTELKGLAKQEQLPVPEELDSRHQSEVTALSSKSGTDFDEAYAATMVKAHKQAIALFKSAAHCSDPNIASFADKTLPTLETHQRMADDLAHQTRVAAADHSAQG